jgi:hypothetical protein
MNMKALLFTVVIILVILLVTAYILNQYTTNQFATLNTGFNQFKTDAGGKLNTFEKSSANQYLL